MRSSILKLIFSVLGLAAISLTLKSETSDETNVLLEKIKLKYESIIDYQADIEVEINVDFINIPGKKARIYFKSPNLVKYESESFIMLPKKGLNFSAAELLTGAFSSIYIGKEMLDGIQSEVVKIVPLTVTNDIILATLWIDAKNLRILKAEASTKKNGTFSMQLSYHKPTDILPKSIVINFELTRMDIPFGFLLETGSQIFQKQSEKTTSIGSVIVKYSNYSINTGLSESFFTDDEKQRKQSTKK